MNKKYILFFLFGLLSITISAQSLAEAKALYEKGEYEEAKPAFKKTRQDTIWQWKLQPMVRCMLPGNRRTRRSLETPGKRRQETRPQRATLFGPGIQ